jgi:hypothetical protein
MLRGCLSIIVIVLVVGYFLGDQSTDTDANGTAQQQSSLDVAPSAQVAPAVSSTGYKITGRQGVMHFVAIDEANKANEDTYRLAAGSACAGERICQVQYWIGSAPNRFPLTDAQVESKVVQWQLNLNTGLRRWLVNCKTSDVFKSERECM